jgi:carbamoyl-phosphate synthase small subunit
MSQTRAPAKLALEDGSIFQGEALGKIGEDVGEVVFNTSLTGYQEVFTDASYNGQMVVMTNPLIGNYGINPEDEESFRVHTRGIIIREISRRASNHRSTVDLETYMKKYGVVGITGLDTRAITKLLRVRGCMKGVISSVDLDERRLVEKARAWEGLGGKDMVAPVTCSGPYVWTEGPNSPFSYRGAGFANGASAGAGDGLRIAAFDFGVKYNILRILRGMGFEVHVLPASASFEDVKRIEPDGVFLSNGPGDPEGLPYAIDTIRSIIDSRAYPIFGICLGHQLLGLALGGRTFKLKFGHHGGNHPVQNIFTKKVDISVQNHCFCVDVDSLDRSAIKPYFINLNDQSLEGMVHTRAPMFSVQFHPEASPGPNDFAFLFDQFASMVRTREALKVT